MIKLEESKEKSIYGGNYYMDNFFKILLDNKEIGIFYFQNTDNCGLELSEGEIYLEYIELFIRGYSREVLKNIFKEFSIEKIIAETNTKNKSYWVHIGASVDEEYSDEFREMYNLNLSINNLK